MGKKSKAKKERRKKEQQEEEAKKAIKEKKKKGKKKGKKKESRIKISKKQILGGILAVVMIAILVSVGYLLFQKAFKPRPIAQLLPAEDTIAIIEINSNFDHNQLSKTFTLLEGHEEYSKENLIKLVEEKFLVDYDVEIKPWLGRVIGVAVIKSPEREQVDLVYFAEVFSETNAKKYIENSAVPASGVEADGRHKALLGEYIIISDNEEVIKELQNPSGARLYDSDSYRRIDDNMPLNKAAYFFVNFNKIDGDFFQAFPFLSEKGLSVETVQPFMSLLDSEGLALVALDDKFAIQTFISLNRAVLQDSEYIDFKEKYSASLSQYVDANAIAFWGGENLEYQVKRMLEALAGGDNAVIDIFDKIIQGYSQKYFGPEINFNTDLLPLFANEFALAMEKDGEEQIYKLIVELNDPSSEAVKIHEIADNFAEIGAVFEPKVVEHVMEDGTVSKEIIAVAEAIIKEEVIYKGTTIYELRMGGQDWVVAYSIIDDVAIIATNSQGIKTAIDAKNGEISSLKTSAIYSKLIAPVLKYSDEVSYFNMEELLQIMFNEETLPPILELVSSLSSGKSYFDDGITSINYLRIK
ncbi:MAG: DUF3352 domain-containing protein [Nitrospirae bacterium]|nr:DUF3352 domain-containing protein [Nitrospirota bacterium]